MRSKDMVIHARILARVGRLPPILTTGHRQLEKTRPDRKTGSQASQPEYNVPVDLLRLIEPDLANGIKSITFGYRRKK